MNSYMSQTTPPHSIPADQMHSFLKDKQAWENAIAMYQGPDPLDHWYNYVCWYENHGHGDPENKFRETLERCLTLYEHSDYYKQDARMVRLWLKYIDMQTNPLHFYQVLYQRGVGRQVAAFYISWAGYYESIQALKEAESVYNLGFQEKAQSYAELHHAHNKLMYVRQQAAAAVAVAATQQQAQVMHKQQPPATQQQLPQQQLQSTQVHYQQQQQQVPHPHPQPQQQQHVQIHEHQAAPSPPVVQLQMQPPQPQQQQQQLQNYRQHVAFQQQQQPQPQPQQLQIPVQHQQQQQQQQQLYQQHANYQQQQIQQHQQQQQQQQLQQHHHQQQQSTAEIGGVPVNYVHQTAAVQIAAHAQPVASPAPVPPIEQQLPAAFPAAQQHHQQQQQQQQQQHQMLEHYGAAGAATTLPPTNQLQLQQSNNSKAQRSQASVAVPEESPIGGIRLPRKFASYCRNNYETWKPALFLEEPEDPCRRCHYAKNLVYPTGAGMEYSPEEIRARRYNVQSEPSPPPPMQHQQQQQVVNQATGQQQQQLQAIDAASSVPQKEQQLEQLHPYYSTSFHHQYEPNFVANDHEAQQSNSNYVKNSDNEVDDDVDDEDEEDDDNLYEQQIQQQQQVQQQSIATTSMVNTVDDLEEQIEASTIRFSMHSQKAHQSGSAGSPNKTIKIKFKKERPQGGDAPNGNNYSAYTIESIYQQEIASPSASGQDQAAVRRNGGHSFHPYLLGHTSTPKTSTSASASRRNKSSTKVKRVNKFQVQVAAVAAAAAAACSSSNSSSAENGGLSNGPTSSTIGGGGGKLPIAAASSAHNNNSIQNATFNDNANYSFSSAAALDNSNCSLSSAVGRLNFRDVTGGGVGLGGGIGVGINAANTSVAASASVADFSTYQENSYFATQHDVEAKERRLQKALETIDRHLAREAIDPFSSELCRAFLTKLDFPGAEDEAHANYKIIQTPLPKISNTRTIALPDGTHFSIDKEVGRGSYGSVYKATDFNTGAVVALKFQKPPNTWEIYICDQVLKRIQSPNVLPGLMDISTAIIAPNASLIATEFSPFGSLLDINNKIRQATTKVMHESLVMHFSAQICNIIEHLHRHKIIHADIKPDNFLLMRIPSTDLHFPSLRLIDFGCAIDMTLFPNGDQTKFRKVIQTDGFTCIEMQEGRPWSYETDLFCIAGTVHVMLLGEYMQLQKQRGGGTGWDIKQKLPRYLKKHVWTKFFGELLNIKANVKLPDLSELRCIFEEEAAKMDSELQSQIRTLSNILYRR